MKNILLESENDALNFSPKSRVKTAYQKWKFENVFIKYKSKTFSKEIKWFWTNQKKKIYN